MGSLVGDILKTFAAAATSISTRAADVLVRMGLCRTKPLGKREYQCERCQETATVFNSCGERHCCRCSGFYRIRWLMKTRQQLVPQTAYLQIVFTIPDSIGELLQHAPAAAYSMLMQAAARETMRLQRRLGITPGAIVVLHTWNQRLLLHLHLHVLIPIAGIDLQTQQWLTIGDRPELAQGGQQQLGRDFRQTIIRRIKRLQKHGKLIFNGRLEYLNDADELDRYLDGIWPSGYRVFVQHAPNGCDDPATVVKYLARYVSGGPISDRRIVSYDDQSVTFLVRDNDRAAAGRRKQQQAITIPATEFVERWALHILPKGFVRVRNYGHASASNRKEYLQRCRQLLGIDADGDPVDGGPIDPVDSPTVPTIRTDACDGMTEHDRFVDADTDDEDEALAIEITAGVSLRCQKCNQPMRCVSFSFRPSWKVIMSGPDRPAWYEP